MCQSSQNCLSLRHDVVMVKLNSIGPNSDCVSHFRFNMCFFFYFWNQYQSVSTFFYLEQFFLTSFFTPAALALVMLVLALGADILDFVLVATVDLRWTSFTNITVIFLHRTLGCPLWNAKSIANGICDAMAMDFSLRATLR